MHIFQFPLSHLFHLHGVAQTAHLKIAHSCETLLPHECHSQASSHPRLEHKPALQFTIVHHGSIILQHHPNLIPESQNVDYGLHIGPFTTHIIVINCKKEIGFALRARNLVLELPSAQVRCLLSVSFTSFIPLCFFRRILTLSVSIDGSSSSLFLQMDPPLLSWSSCF